MINYHIQPGGRLRGTHCVPGDKSISHRVLMLGAIAGGETRINGFLAGEDTLATWRVLQMMGVDIARQDDEIVVHGVGLHGLQTPESPLNLGNSGTAARLLVGLLAGQTFNSQIIGDESLMQRPMQRIVGPLRQMQANIQCSENGTLPINISGGQSLKGIDYHMPVGSAQLKSCLLLAGLYASGTTCVHEPVMTRDHTERLLQYFGCELTIEGKQVCLSGGQHLQGRVVTVPADISSAAFFMVGATIGEGSDITLENVGVNPARDAVIPVLQAMGADITLSNQRTVSGEPVADIRVRSSRLRGVDIDPVQVAPAIDEFPAIMVAAACAHGKTRLKGAKELRFKESDRIQSIATGLQSLGIDVQTLDDGMTVTGGQLTGGKVDSFGDHRIAMAFAMAGLSANDAITISDCANVGTSFPGFVPLAKQAGLAISEQSS